MHSPRAVALVMSALLASAALTFAPSAAASGPLFSEDFESGAPGWTPEGLWHLSTVTGSTAFWYGQEETGDYDTGAANAGRLVSPTIDLTGATGAITLRFHEVAHHEPDFCPAERPIVQVSFDGTNFVTIDDRCVVDHEGEVAVDLSFAAGSTIQLGFLWDTSDGAFNGFFGWAVDDVRVVSGAPELFPSGLLAEPIQDGARLTISITNSGPVPASAVASVTLFDEFGSYRGTNTIGFSVDGESTVDVLLGDYGIEPGAWRAEVQVDSDSQHAEPDEGNNFATYLFGVGEPNLRANVFATGDASGTTITLSVTDHGEGFAESFSAGFVVTDANGVEVAADQTSFAGLAGGHTVVAAFGPFDLPPGDYMVEGVADIADEVAERDETDNSALAFFFVQEPFVDLQVFHQHAPGAATGSFLDITAYPTNQGNVEVQVVEVRLEVFDAQGFLAHSEDRDVGPLCGGCQTATTFTTLLADGDYTIVTTIDPNGLVAEVDESNSYTTTVTVGGSGEADLVVSSFTHEPEPATQDQPVTLIVEVRNEGGFFSNQNSLGLFLRWPDGTLEQFMEDQVPALAAGSGVTMAYEIGFVPDGVYTLLASVDIYGQIPESNESNNEREHVLVVGDDGDASDLVADAAVSGTLEEGETVTLEGLLTNLGMIDLGEFRATLYLDGDVVVDTMVMGISGGETQSLTASFVATPGAHEITFVVDGDNVVGESNEANNIATVSFFVEADPVAPADLSVTVLGVDRSPVRTDLGDIGLNPLGRRTVEVAACNAGDETLLAGGQVLVTAESYAYKVDAPTSIELGVFEIPELEGGECATFHARWDPAGTLGDVSIVARGASPFETASNPSNDSDVYEDFVLVGGFGGVALL